MAPTAAKRSQGAVFIGDRPAVALPEDEKTVLTVLRDAVAQRAQPLTVPKVQRLTWWPTRTGAGRELGRQRVSRALRSLPERGLAARETLGQRERPV